MTQRAIDGPYVYFVTTNTAFRRKFFITNAHAKQIGRSIIGACALKNFDLLGYCILPDHLHLLVQNRNTPQRGFRNPRCGDGRQHTLSDLMHSIKRNYSRQLHAGRIWQRRFYYQIIEDERRLANTVEYMQNNFQKHGLVEQFGRPPFVEMNWTAVNKVVGG